MKVKRLIDGIDAPNYGSKGAAGLDLRASGRFMRAPIYNDEKHIFEADSYKLAAGAHVVVLTGYSVAIPDGHYGLIKPRSGLAAKYGIHVGAGVIDCDYRGEIGVILANLGNKIMEINKNKRIAQMIIKPYATVNIELAEELDDTERGSGGFGSTGER